MFRKNIAVGTLIAAATATVDWGTESSYSCSKFKEYVEDEFDCGYDYMTCKNIVSCDIYVCDGSSKAEKTVSQGGLLYELNCGSMASYDTWMKICELEKSLHPEDKESSIYKLLEEKTFPVEKKPGQELELQMSQKLKAHHL